MAARHETTQVPTRTPVLQTDPESGGDAGGLRLVKAGVGDAVELLAAAAVLGKARDAGRHRDPPGEHSAHARGDRVRAVAVGAGQQDGELVAAQATDRI